MDESHVWKSFYVAVGQPVTDRSELPDRFQMLESLIENKFYQKETRVFLPDHVSEDTGSEQFLDETISRMIENIRLDDMTHLWEHFHLLKMVWEIWAAIRRFTRDFCFPIW